MEVQVLPGQGQAEAAIHAGDFGDDVGGIVLLTQVEFCIAQTGHGEILDIIMIEVVLAVQEVYTGHLVPGCQDRRRGPEDPGTPLPAGQAAYGSGRLGQPGTVTGSRIDKKDVMLQPGLTDQAGQRRFI